VQVGLRTSAGARQTPGVRNNSAIYFCKIV